jgi:tRNA-dihydrouridine synthase B
MPSPQLADPWRLGSLQVPNRVLLAPLAGIGNWFVRLQAKRHGAGLAFSEMVSSHAIHYRNERTLCELLRIHPDERVAGPGAGSVRTAGAGIDPVPAAPTSIQLFGGDPEVMRSAAATVAAAGADAIDLNMGCPVPKVCKTGAGAALLSDPSRAVEVARAAVEGAATRGDAAPVPVTVKLRSGQRPGETSGFELAHRLVEDAGVAAITFHPRSAAVHHKGVPDYDLAARLAASLPAPVILTGGMSDAYAVRAAFARTGVAAVMLARGCLGNPWLFEEALGARSRPPTRAEVLDELQWTVARAIEHLGEPRATRYLRKFYPWYVARLGLGKPDAQALTGALQLLPTARDARYTAALAAPGRVAIPARAAGFAAA